MRKAWSIPALAVLVALAISLSACDTGQPSAPSESNAAPTATSATAQSLSSEATAATAACLSSDEFAQAVQAAEKRAADALGIAPGKLSIKVDSSVVCQGQFAAARTTVTQTGHNLVAQVPPGTWVIVLRQKSLRTGVPSDTGWELIDMMSKGVHSVVCTMPPPKQVAEFLHTQGLCTN